MSLAVAASFSLGSTSSSNFEPNAQQSGSFRPLDRSLFPTTLAGTINRGYWVKPARAEPKRSKLQVPPAAAFAAPVVVEKLDKCIEGDYEKVTKDRGKTSPLEIIIEALGKLGDINIDVAFSSIGAEDVTLIESWLTGCLLWVFIDAMKKFYGIDHIDNWYPVAVEVLPLVGNNELFLSHKDGHQECCQVRKVTPLWITGLKDQSRGTRASIPLIRADPTFEAKDGGIGILLKRNVLANVNNEENWSLVFTKAMEGSPDGFDQCPPLIMMMSKAILYLSSCTELGLLSSSNMLLPQCAW